MSIFDSLVLTLSEDKTNILLKPEDEDTNIEYKLRLDTKSQFGLKKLKSQMNWRLFVGKELYGKKEAHYVLGINDDGTLGKISEDEIENTYNILKEIIEENKCIIVLKEKKQFGAFYLIYVVIQQIEINKINEIYVAFVGPTQHGKTTTISKIVNSQNDDGDGYSRKLIFSHEHEKTTGFTSSIKKEIVGLKDGKLINYSYGIRTSWENIVDMSEVIVNVIDLPGCFKYVKTTFFGLLAYKIDALVVVIDVKKDYDENIVTFYKIFADALNIPYVVALINNTFPLKENHINIDNVSGNINELVDFFNKIYKNSKINKNENTVDSDSLFTIAKTYFIPDSGIIFSGSVKQGKIYLGQTVYLSDGKEYHESQIKSIHKKQINSQYLFKDESGAIQLEHNFLKTNKHMVITTSKYKLYKQITLKVLYKICNSFEYKLNELKIGMRSLLFVENNIISIKIINKKDDIYTLSLDNSIIITNVGLCVFLKYANSYCVGKIVDMS